MRLRWQQFVAHTHQPGEHHGHQAGSDQQELGLVPPGAEGGWCVRSGLVHARCAAVRSTAFWARCSMNWNTASVGSLDRSRRRCGPWPRGAVNRSGAGAVPARRAVPPCRVNPEYVRCVFQRCRSCTRCQFIWPLVLSVYRRPCGGPGRVGGSASFSSAQLIQQVHLLCDAFAAGRVDRETRSSAVGDEEGHEHRCHDGPRAPAGVVRGGHGASPFNACMARSGLQSVAQGSTCARMTRFHGPEQRFRYGSVAVSRTFGMQRCGALLHAPMPRSVR